MKLNIGLIADRQHRADAAVTVERRLNHERGENISRIREHRDRTARNIAPADRIASQPRAEEAIGVRTDQPHAIAARNLNRFLLE